MVCFSVENEQFFGMVQVPFQIMVDCNGKGKRGVEVWTSPMECAKPNPIKGGRDSRALGHWNTGKEYQRIKGKREKGTQVEK